MRRLLICLSFIGLLLSCAACPRTKAQLQIPDPIKEEANQGVISTVSVSVDSHFHTNVDPKGDIDHVRGTAIVISQDAGARHSLLLSALHLLTVSVDDTKPEDIFIDSRSMKVTTFVGDDCPAHVLATDHGHDLMLIIADCDAGTVAPIAKSNPERGARIVAVGNAANLHAPFMMPFTEGRFLGYTFNPVKGWDWPVALYSCPVIPGMSGGAFLSDGKVVGVISATVGEFPTLSTSAPLWFIQSFVKENPPPWQSTHPTSR